MKRSSLFCAGWWPFIFLPLLLLLPLLFFQWHAIEEDVAKNTSDKLAAGGQEWAKVETFNRGREVLITGTPPNQEAIDQAYQLAKNAYGVNSVELSPGVKVPEAPPSNPKLDAIVTGDSIVLRGVLKDQASIDALVSQADATFGATNVVNKLTIGENTAALPNLSGFFGELAGKTDGLNTLSASLNNGLITLTGKVQNSDIKASIGQQITQLFAGTVNNQLTVAAPPPPPPVERDVCQDLVNELLSKGKINFASGKAVIKEDSYSLLDSITQIAKRCPDAAFEVAGHTDSVGNLSSNMSLSEKRAQAVVDHLVGLGLNAAQFSSAGYGPNQPIGDNSTAEGRAQNRRIEFKLKN